MKGASARLDDPPSSPTTDTRQLSRFMGYLYEVTRTVRPRGEPGAEEGSLGRLCLVRGRGLRAGDSAVRFPAGCFPPPLPYISG